MAGATAAAPPSVEIRSTEVELAPWSILLGRDSQLSGKLPEGVPVQSEVIGGVARVEPLVVALTIVCETLDNCGGYPLYELRDHMVDDRQLSGSCGVGLRSFESAWQPSKLPQAGGVR
jgi:hypothetical protein